MEFYTRINIPKSSFLLSYTDSIVMIGSCFAENIGKLLQENKFNTDLNPFGILYNPGSIAKAIHMLVQPDLFTSKELVHNEGTYHSFMHHSRFSSVSQEDILDTINNRLILSSEKLLQADRLIITFGTAYVYRLKSNGKIVANCHKLPDKLFSRERLTTEEIVNEWKDLLLHLWEHNPKIKILFTVSPIRHWKDGAHNNQLSKATLLLAIDNLQKEFADRVEYFPAYEILMDELRDYRFYAEDMCHPSSQAVGYIWQRFIENYFSSETLILFNEWNEILKAINHKPFQAESESYKQFIRQTLLKMDQINRKMPSFDMAKERFTLESKLK